MCCALWPLRADHPPHIDNAFRLKLSHRLTILAATESQEWRTRDLALCTTQAHSDEFSDACAILQFTTLEHCQTCTQKSNHTTQSASMSSARERGIKHWPCRL